MEARGEVPRMPEVPAPYLLEWWYEIGPTVPAGMGEAPIGWPDLAAWSETTGIELEPWEARTLRRMSREFIEMRFDARKPDCPEPYARSEAEILSQRDIVARKVDAAFKGLVRKKV